MPVPVGSAVDAAGCCDHRESAGDSLPQEDPSRETKRGGYPVLCASIPNRMR